MASKSEQIRQMAAEGMTKGQIAKVLDIKFQFVYNVLKNAENKAIVAAHKAAQAADTEK